MEVYLWAIELDSLGTKLNEFVDTRLNEHDGGILSRSEQERAGRFRFDADRFNFLRSRLFLRLVLSASLGSQMTPDKVQLETGFNGKPGIGNGGDLQFNFSRSDKLAICGVANGRRIGVDIESPKEMPDRESVARVIFSASEKRCWDDCPDERKSSLFYRAWTRKEALGKADGSGISAGASNLCVPMEATEPGQCFEIERADSQAGRSCRWCLSDWAGFEPTPVAIVVELHENEVVAGYHDQACAHHESRWQETARTFFDETPCCRVLKRTFFANEDVL